MNSQTSSHILVVDDDLSHLKTLKTIVTSWGYKASEADDGMKAAELAKERPYDLILMDIRMAELSGIQALKRIKAYNPTIPIIIMTAYSSVDSAVAALKSGAYDYLTKPLDFDEVKLTLEWALEHSGLKAENKDRRNFGNHAGQTAARHSGKRNSKPQKTSDNSWMKKSWL
jgi:two-component system, NtrC family, response regulator HydG